MKLSRAEQLISYSIVLAFLAFVVVPMLNVLFTALHEPHALIAGFGVPKHLTFAAFSNAWSEAHLGSNFVTSTIIALVGVGLTTVVSIGAGYALGTMRVPGGGLVLVLFMIGIIVPFETMMIPLYYDLQHFNLTDTYWAVILPESAVATAFGAFWMRAFFRAVPRTLLEAARIDGANSLTILWRILIPLGRPAITTLMVLTFMWSWNDFLLPLIMLSGENLSTATVGLALFRTEHVTTTDYPSWAAAAILVALPVVIVFLFLQRHFIRGMLSGAIKV